MTYIINLIAQDFIATLESEAIVNNIVFQLENKQVQNIAKNTDLSVVIKKIFVCVIIQKDNIFAESYLDLRSYCRY